MIATRTTPARDTVLYDGQCRFCRSQIALLRRLDLGGSLHFTSLHDPAVPEVFPELSRDDLLAQMYVIDTAGRARGGAEAVRYLSRKLPLLWPLAVWQALYRFVARNRMRIAGSCTEGTCRLPE